MTIRKPLGTYHAVSCKDPSSMERDGEPFYEFNRLPSSTGRSVAYNKRTKRRK